MVRAMRLVAVAFALAAIGTGVAFAAVTTNESDTISFSTFVPCANGGAGEVVAGDIQLHVLLTMTINANSVTVKELFQPQGGALVGQSTGDVYRATGNTQDIQTASLTSGQSTFTFINNFRIIGPGTGNNFLAHEAFHVTVGADGTVVTTHDNVSETCK